MFYVLPLRTQRLAQSRTKDFFIIPLGDEVFFKSRKFKKKWTTNRGSPFYLVK